MSTIASELIASSAGPEPVENLLLLKEVQKYLRASRSTIYRLIDDGALRAWKVGEHGDLRFHLADVEKVLIERRPKKRNKAIVA